MFFSVKAKNRNWEILTKNFVTFKRWDGFKGMKNFSIMGVHWNIWFLKGVHKKPIYRGGLPKKVGLGKFADSREGLGKNRGRGYFWGGLITQCI